MLKSAIVLIHPDVTTYPGCFILGTSITPIYSPKAKESSTSAIIQTRSFARYCGCEWMHGKSNRQWKKQKMTLRNLIKLEFKFAIVSNPFNTAVPFHCRRRRVGRLLFARGESRCWSCSALRNRLSTCCAVPPWMMQTAKGQGFGECQDYRE